MLFIWHKGERPMARNLPSCSSISAATRETGWTRWRLPSSTNRGFRIILCIGANHHCRTRTRTYLKYLPTLRRVRERARLGKPGPRPCPSTTYDKSRSMHMQYQIKQQEGAKKKKNPRRCASRDATHLATKGTRRVNSTGDENACLSN